MKIYTKKGDAGETSLLGGGALFKDHPRIQAYGNVDELNSVLGAVVAELEDQELSTYVREVQRELFALGTELATPEPQAGMLQNFLSDKQIQKLEQQIDRFEQELEPLTRFILPGGKRGAAMLHLARTVCRRAERSVVTLGHQESLRAEPLQYLNRLSDWCFVLARLVNHRSGEKDIHWEGKLS